MAWNKNTQKYTPGLPIWKQEGGDAVCRDSDTGEELQRNSLELKTRLGVDFFEQFAVTVMHDIEVDDGTVTAGSTAFASITPGGQVMLFEYNGSHTVIDYGKEGCDFEVK